MTMSRPVFMPPSVRSTTRLRRPLSSRTWCASATPSSHGRAGVLDRGERRRARAAVVAGDEDDIGVRLGHARGDRADAGFGHELDADLGARVDLLEVVDELRQVLDGVDVVVRRRRDQRDAGHGVAQPRDDGADLVAGQLAALAGLGALRHLDLDLLRAGEVLRGDAEAAGGDLLDARCWRVAVLAALEARADLRRLRRNSTCRRCGSWRWRASRAPRARARRATCRRW